MTVLIQRPLRGSRISSFYPIKSLPSLSSLDSAFQLQEYISLLIRLDVHDVDTIVSVPGHTKNDKSNEHSEPEGAKDTEKDKDKGKVEVDEACWIYEQLRRLAQDLSHPLITMLQLECSRASCPEMKAGEWLYLCVAHGNEGAMEQCCAIDYILHTLDSATALLNSPRAFPSRLQIPEASHRHFSSLARRLGRIFAHAYFHHREVFEQAEAESSLYARFLALTSKYDLVPAEFLVIPPRMQPEMDIDPPRLLGASVNPSDGNISPPKDNVSPGPNQRLREDWDRFQRAKSESPPGLGGGSESPRKMGRNRTDTMVFHEGFSPAMMEELAKQSEQEDLNSAKKLSEEPLSLDTDTPIAHKVMNAETSPDTEESPLEAETREEEPPEADITSASIIVDLSPAPEVTPSSSTVPQNLDEIATEAIEEVEVPPLEETVAEHTVPDAAGEEPHAAGTAETSVPDAIELPAVDISTDVAIANPTEPPTFDDAMVEVHHAEPLETVPSDLSTSEPPVDTIKTEPQEVASNPSVVEEPIDVQTDTEVPIPVPAPEGVAVPEPSGEDIPENTVEHGVAQPEEPIVVEDETKEA